MCSESRSTLCDFRQLERVLRLFELCMDCAKKEFSAASTHTNVRHRLATNIEGDSDFDAGKFESKLTPKRVEELVGKDVVCKGRRVSHMHKLNSTVVQGYSTVLA